MVYEKSVILAYHADNQETAQQLHQQLNASKYQFEHLVCDDSTDAPNLIDRLRETTRPVLLFVSDNYLKSTQCMAEGLKMIQQLGSSNRILPLIIDGKAQNEDSGEWESVPTRFERVSDVIQYMNYWQNEYLDLRKQKRNMDADLEEAFNQRLRLVRSISSEVGEYLRQLRVTPNYSLEEFEKNDYEIFFRFMNDLAAHQQFKNAPKDEFIAIGNGAGGSQLMTDLAPSFPEEPSSSEELDLEDPPIDISTIPGIDQLEDLSPEEEPEFEQHDPSATVIMDNQVQPDLPENEAPPGENSQPEEVNETSGPVMGDSSMDEDLIEGEAAETHTADLSHLLRQDQDDEPAFPDEEEESDDWEEEDEQEEETPSTPVDQPVDSADIDEEEDDDDEEDDEAYDDEEEEEEEDDDDFEEEEAMDPDENAYNHPIQLVERAKAFMENDAPESGLNLYREGIKLFPKESSIRFQYAMALLKYKNQRQAAREVLEEILEIDDAHEHAHFVLGELAELEQQYLEARDHYERVAELNQHFPNIYYRLGLLSIQHFDDEVERAAGYFEAAIDADKYNADAHYQYAILLSERLDDPKHSLKHFKKTLKYQKHHPFANYDLAVIYHQLGEPDKAYKYYQRAVLINPELRTPENEEAFKVPQAPEPEEETPVLAQEAPEAVQPKTIADTLGIVLITGATSGIGKATAIAFAEHNYSLLLTGRREDRLTTLATELHEQYGVPVQTKVFDVRDLDATKEALASLDEDWAQVDILINNAGLAKGFAPIHEGSFEHWETMIDTNIKGLLYMTRLITPGMVARGKGHIINISSSAGKEVYPNGNVYCATKFAVEALTKSMRLDLYKHGLKVSQVSPGHVEETEFAVVRFDGDTEKAKIYEDFQPLKASDVAAAIYYIASQPPHVNIQDIFLMGTQQAGSNFVDRSGRD